MAKETYREWEDRMGDLPSNEWTPYKSGKKEPTKQKPTKKGRPKKQPDSGPVKPKDKPRVKKPEWSETKAGKEWAKAQAKRNADAKKKDNLARQRKHLKAAQIRNKQPIKKSYTPSKSKDVSGLSIRRK